MGGGESNNLKKKKVRAFLVFPRHNYIWESWIFEETKLERKMRLSTAGFNPQPHEGTTY